MYCWCSHQGRYSDPDDPLNDLRGRIKYCTTFYPVKSGGYLSTIQYEGLREAVDDLRYLATARKAIAALDASGDPAARERAKALERELREAIGPIEGLGKKTHEESEALRAALVRIIQAART